MTSATAMSLAVGLWVSGNTSLYQELSPKEIYARCSKSVATVAVECLDGRQAQGSGFVVAPKRLATCWHVVCDASSSTLTFIGGSKQEARIVSASPKHDLAILAFDSDIPALSAQAESPAPGERLYAIGAPEGLEGSINEGLMSQSRKFGEFTAHQISNPVTFGNSGGPVLDSSGRVVGVVSFGYEGESALNFAIPVQFAKQLAATGTPLTFDEFRRTKLPNCHTFINRSKAGDVAISRLKYTAQTQNCAAITIESINRQDVLSVKDGTELRRWRDLERWQIQDDKRHELATDPAKDIKLDRFFNRIEDQSGEQTPSSIRIARAVRYYPPSSIGVVLFVGDKWSTKIRGDSSAGIPDAEYTGTFEAFENANGVRCARVKYVFQEVGIIQPIRVEMTVWHVYGLESVQMRRTSKNLPLAEGLADITDSLDIIYWKNGPRPLSDPSRSAGYTDK